MPDLKPRAFLYTLFGLAAIYALWLAAHWPGVLGNDTLAVLYEVTGKVPGFSSGKTSIWVNFVKLPYQLTGSIGWVTACQMLLMALMFARMLSGAGYGLWLGLSLGLGVVLTPHMLALSGTLYPDSLFAVGSATVLFELWLSLRHRRLSGASLFFLGISLPFALFGRTNGLVLLLPLAYTAWVLRGSHRIKLIAVTLLCCTVALVGNSRQPGKPQSALFPMVVFETINFLQPRPFSVAFGLPAHQLSPATLEVLHRYADTPTLLQAYDRDYWDSLIHTDNSPKLGRISDSDRRVLVREFFRHNLWQNMPAFLASRLNVFLVSALGHGHFPTPGQTAYVLRVFEPSTPAASHWPRLKAVFDALHKLSWDWRWLLWSPLIGIALMLATLRLAFATRSMPELVLMASMLVQLLGIGFISSAGEYRYLLPFFVLPLAATPMWLHLKQRQRMGSQCP